MKPWMVVALAAMVVLVLWGTWLLVPVLAGMLPANAVVLGAVGDMFGVASALFAGVGSLAVFVVLYFDLRHRRSELRPYASVNIATASARIVKARWDDGVFYLSIRVGLKVSNLTGVPALNLAVSDSDIVWGLGRSEHASIDSANFDTSPLEQGTHRDLVVRVSRNGAEARSLARALERQESVTLRFRARYSSLNGTRWRSDVDASLSVEDSKDVKLLGQALIQKSGEFIDSEAGIGGTDPVYLEMEAVAGTWTQRSD